jgi:hypothetical protein
MEYLDMSKIAPVVEDNETNREICRKYCGNCPTFKNNNLKEYPPYELFCAGGRSTIAEKTKTTACYCPACEIFTHDHLVIGHFCTKS